MSSMIKISELTKTYGLRNGKNRVEALRGIDLEIGRGELFGLLGPNGAGKTTLIQCVTTLLTPTSGTILVDGYDAVKEPSKVRESIGCMLTGERSIYWKLTGRENLDYFGALYHLPKARRRDRIEELASLLSMGDFLERRVETYSSGQRMKVAFAKALIADPPLVILDEPTITLDVSASKELRLIVREINKQGTTVIYTTHLMFEAEALCDRVAIIDQGVIKGLGTVRELKALVGGQREIRLVVSEPQKAAMSLNGVSGIESISVGNGSLRLVYKGSGLDEVLKRVLGSGNVISDLSVSQLDLEAVFLKLTGRSLVEG